MWYDDFAPVTDAEVTACIHDSRLNIRGEGHRDIDSTHSGKKGPQKEVIIYGAEK
jgi:hypothetical protein